VNTYIAQAGLTLRGAQPTRGCSRLDHIEQATSVITMADTGSTQQQTFEHDEPVQVDDTVTQDAGGTADEADSALGYVLPESTASLTSSILRYRTVHGRTYHSEGGNAQYW